MAKIGHKGNGHAHVTKTPDVSHVRNIDVTHELSDVNVAAILKFVVALTIMTIGVYLLVWLMFRFFNAQENKRDNESPPGPMAMTEQESLPPEPRLQAAKGFGVKMENGQWINLERREPQAEYSVLREQWERLLREGSKDQSGNTVILPIEEAMRKVVEGQGLPSRTQQGAPQEMTDYTIGAPTAASSGRVNARVKQ